MLILCLAVICRPCRLLAVVCWVVAAFWVALAGVVAPFWVVPCVAAVAVGVVVPFWVALAGVVVPVVGVAALFWVVLCVFLVVVAGVAVVGPFLAGVVAAPFSIDVAALAAGVVAAPFLIGVAALAGAHLAHFRWVLACFLCCYYRRFAVVWAGAPRLYLAAYSGLLLSDCFYYLWA